MEVPKGAIICTLLSLVAHVYGKHFQGGAFSWKPVNIPKTEQRGVSKKLKYYIYLFG